MNYNETLKNIEKIYQDCLEHHIEETNDDVVSYYFAINDLEKQVTNKNDFDIKAIQDFVSVKNKEYLSLFKKSEEVINDLKEYSNDEILEIEFASDISDYFVVSSLSESWLLNDMYEFDKVITYVETRKECK